VAEPTAPAITINFIGEIRPEVRAVVERMVRAAERVTPIRHAITVHIAPAPAIRAGDSGEVGFGYTQVDTRTPGAPVHIALAGDGPPLHEDDPVAVEDFLLSTFCHELAHYEQHRDGKPLQERGVEVRARNLRRLMSEVRGG